jgi:RNA polymerase sigma-70 factor (ECF subfamily)
MNRPDIDKLAVQVAGGDTTVYQTLLQECARIIRGYVYARVGARDRSAVEDIVQDTLLAIHTKYHSYDPSMAFLPWLRTIAHHKLIDHWRRQKISDIVSIDDNEIHLLIASDTQQTDTIMSLEKLFENLSDKQKHIVQLARLEGKTMVEIATELSLSVSDVKVTLHRAIQKLSSIALHNHKNERQNHEYQ